MLRPFLSSRLDHLSSAQIFLNLPYSICKGFSIADVTTVISNLKSMLFISLKYHRKLFSKIALSVGSMFGIIAFEIFSRTCECFGEVYMENPG